jgi:GT2 family glycosyltransferase
LKVTAVIPTLGSDPELLQRAVESLGPECELVLSVDLPESALALDAVASRAQRVVWTGGGAGFAGAAQLGIDAVGTELVLLLNDDAWLEEGAVAALVDAVGADRVHAGAAPKIRFERWPEILNSVGTVLAPDGWADSRGIGQPDVGQYDRSERVFGLHFAAALVRRSLFNEGEVGPLDTSFGSYYEDIDWCLRANLRGYEFVSAPEAVAVHRHSTTVGQQPLGFQFRLQQRNLIWTVAKSFEPSNATRGAARRMAALVRTRLRGGPLAKEASRALREAAAGMSGVLRRRADIQRQRVVGDAEVLALCAGEKSWFDQSAGPILDKSCLIEALDRLGNNGNWVEPLRRALIDRDALQVGSVLSEAPSSAALYCARLGLGA